MFESVDAQTDAQMLARVQSFKLTGSLNFGSGELRTFSMTRVQIPVINILRK